MPVAAEGLAMLATMLAGSCRGVKADHLPSGAQSTGGRHTLPPVERDVAQVYPQRTIANDHNEWPVSMVCECELCRWWAVVAGDSRRWANLIMKP